jgi:hypothetical protein
MDFLDRISGPLTVILCFALLAVIVRYAALSIRAFIQGINEADDPRPAKHDATHAATPIARPSFRIDKRWIKSAVIWTTAYVTCVVTLFIYLTSGGWMRLSVEPELFVSIIAPLLVLRLSAYFLRLGKFILPSGRRPR